MKMVVDGNHPQMKSSSCAVLDDWIDELIRRNYLDSCLHVVSELSQYEKRTMFITGKITSLLLLNIDCNIAHMIAELLYKNETTYMRM